MTNATYITTRAPFATSGGDDNTEGAIWAAVAAGIVLCLSCAGLVSSRQQRAEQQRYQRAAAASRLRQAERQALLQQQPQQQQLQYLKNVAWTGEK